MMTVIQPRRGFIHMNLLELWRQRELVGFLVWRNVKVRYKQTAIGVVWALLQPLVPLLVFCIFFGRVAKVPSDGVPYPIFAYCALLPWQLFASSLTESASSLVTDERLVTKIYFPRFVIPTSAVLAGLLDFAIAGVFFMIMLMWYKMVLTIRVLAIPFLLLMAVAASLGMGLWLSALNVKYRDVRYALPLLIQFWLFASPIAYSNRLVPEAWRWLYSLNPMSGVIEGFRWALLNTPASGSIIAISGGVIAVVFVTGLYYFRRVEGTFADLI